MEALDCMHKCILKVCVWQFKDVYKDAVSEYSVLVFEEDNQ